MNDTPSSRLQAALQSTLLWGSLCMFATIVLTVVAVMIHDFRWVLSIAWPFAGIAIWEFARIIFIRRSIVLAVTGVVTSISGLCLLWLYFALVPMEQQVAKEEIKLPETMPPAQKPQPVGQQTDSTWSKAIYKCNVQNVLPDAWTRQEGRDFQEYMKVFADTYDYIVAFPNAVGGNKAELTPKRNNQPISKMAFETRRLGRDFLGIFTAEFNSSPYDMYSSLHLDPGSDFEVRIRRRIEHLIGVEKGNCELQ